MSHLGKISKHYTRILPDYKVKAVLSSYELACGRITFRYK